MSKVKAAKGSKPVKSDEILTKVKGAGVAKPAQTEKAKSKDIAKEVAKKEKKTKKTKEPTPEPESESESESESDTSVSSTEDSDSEAEVKPVTNGKTNGVKAAAKDDSSSEESESDESESEDEAPKSKAAPAADSDSSESESDDSSESDSEDEKPAAKSKVMGAKLAAAKDDSSDESSSDDDSDFEEPAKSAKKDAAATQSSSEDSDSESEESDDEEDEAPKPKSNKRKAEEDAPATVKKVKTDGEESEGTKNLFVGNLSWNMTEDWLKEEFEAYGEVEGCRIMTDRATGRSKGFGYVEFKNAADAAKALEAKNGEELDGRALNVDFSNPRPSTEQRQDNRRKQYSDQLSEPSDTLFVGNLSFDAGQDAVTQAFAPHGTPVGVRIPTDPETGNFKGFGYVTFGSVEEAQTVLEAMQGQYIEGRPIRLDFSQPRPQNNGSPRGGFGGRGGGRGGRGGFNDRGRGGFGGRGGGRGRGGDRGGRGGRGGTTNRGGFGDFSGKKTTF